MFERALGTDPDRYARVYWLPGRGHTNGRRVDGAFSIQYWFFHGFDYLPRGHGIVARGYREGDWEHTAVLFSPDGRPRYVFPARHNDEHMRYHWGDRRMMFRAGAGDGCAHAPTLPLAKRNHPCVFLAQGSHASSNRCGQFRRDRLVDSVLRDDISECDPAKRRHFFGSATLDRLGTHVWACWQGRVGARTPAALAAIGVQAPAMPMRKQSAYNGGNPCEAAPYTRSVLRRAASTPPAARPAQAPDGEPLLGPEETMAAEAQGGSMLNEVDECSDWSRPDGVAVMVLACDPDQLRAFTSSELTDDTQLTLRTDPSEPPHMPAVSEDEAPTGPCPLEATGATRPIIRVMVQGRDGAPNRMAEFPRVALAAGQRVRIEAAPGGFVVIDAASGAILAARAARHRAGRRRETGGGARPAGGAPRADRDGELPRACAQGRADRRARGPAGGLATARANAPAGCAERSAHRSPAPRAGRANGRREDVVLARDVAVARRAGAPGPERAVSALDLDDMSEPPERRPHGWIASIGIGVGVGLTYFFVAGLMSFFVGAIYGCGFAIGDEPLAERGPDWLCDSSGLGPVILFAAPVVGLLIAGAVGRNARRGAAAWARPVPAVAIAGMAPALLAAAVQLVS